MIISFSWYRHAFLVLDTEQKETKGNDSNKMSDNFGLRFCFAFPKTCQNQKRKVAVFMLRHIKLPLLFTKTKIMACSSWDFYYQTSQRRLPDAAPRFYKGDLFFSYTKVDKRPSRSKGKEWKISQGDLSYYAPKSRDSSLWWYPLPKGFFSRYNPTRFGHFFCTHF